MLSGPQSRLLFFQKFLLSFVGTRYSRAECQSLPCATNYLASSGFSPDEVEKPLLASSAANRETTRRVVTNVRCITNV